MPASGRLRASDRDRDRAIGALGEHHAEGRLDFDEFSRRMEAAQRATFVDELSAQFEDLPRQRTPPRPASKRSVPFAALRLLPLALIVVAVGLALAVHLLPLWLPLVALWVVACQGRRRDADRSRLLSGPARSGIRIEHCSRSRSGQPFPIGFQQHRSW